MVGEKFRSVLFTPGISERMIEKARGLGSDVLVLDLEDAVAASEKDTARIIVRAALDRPFPCPVYVRVNGMDSGLTGADLEAVVCPALAGVFLPKAESAEQVAEFEELISESELRAGLEQGTLQLIPIIETARGVLRAAEIARSSGVRLLALGGVDLVRDLGIPFGLTADLSHVRFLVALASRAAELGGPIDTVYPILGDDEGFSADARAAKAMGFQGKVVIHPAQVRLANTTFGPSEEELARAREVVAAFDRATSQGLASIRLPDGTFVDYAVANRARELLNLYGGKEEQAQDGQA